MSSLDALGPGTPTPLTVGTRQIGRGKPLDYQPRQHNVQADTAATVGGQNVNVAFQPRPPIHPPGAAGVGETGSFVDAKA
jgi:hypothetical protein